MADDQPQLIPTDDEALTAEEELAALDSFDAGGPVDVEVAEPTPPPPGRGVLWDWRTNTAVRGTGASSGPVETRGDLTLYGRIEKILRTDRGSSPIHPPEYGIVRPLGMLGRPFTEVEHAKLEQAVRTALTFDPLITDVVNFKAQRGPDPTDDGLWISFDVIRVNAEPLPVETDFHG